MIKRDINNLKPAWESWKEQHKKGIPEVSEHNAKIILSFLSDMELGVNISKASSKGQRSVARLISLKDRTIFFAKNFKNKKFDTLKKEEAHKLFSDMREGKIRKKDNTPYKATGEYIKDFKCLMGWLKRTGLMKEDISDDLARRDDHKPSWVYLTEEQFKKLANQSHADYRALIWFLYDSGIRPQEAYSLRVNDFSEDFTKLHIRDEISKTFGRAITLKVCSSLLKEYAQNNRLHNEDFLINKQPPAFNKYLRSHAERLFGRGTTKARKSYDKMRLYDIRHNASCFWLKRYDKTTQLMYRMGWVKETEVRYYSEFLGMTDEISDDNMVTSEDKTKMEKEIEALKQANNMYEQKFTLFTSQIEELMNKAKQEKKLLAKSK